MRQQLPKLNYRSFSLFLFLGALACRKSDFQEWKRDNSQQGAAICHNCDYLKNIYDDILDRPTILGEEMQNPYLLPNMREAYKNVHGHFPWPGLAPTHLYVQFSPDGYGQLDQLEQEDIELFNYPLHRKLITEGGYYVQSGKNLEDIPDYYAVVGVSYIFPRGINYRVIARMFIPDNEPAWENEALRLTGNLDDKDESISSTNNLQDGEIIGRSAITPRDTLYPSSAPSSCNHYPSGRIMVQNELLNDHSYRGVQQLTVTVRRLYKIEKLSTNNKGEFRCSKYFPNNYTVLAAFKNSHARIARMRPWAIHEQFFPIEINFGKWSVLDCGHEFRIDHPRVTGTIATSHWCAAIAHNGILEHREMCQQEHIGLPPNNLNIMISMKKGSGNGNTYMLNKILQTGKAVNGVEALIGSVVAAWSPVDVRLTMRAIEAFKKRAPDIKFGYGGYAEFLSTDRYCELVYHELSHAVHYNAVGNNWWIKLGLAENNNPGVGTYGECCTSHAPCIALAEGWAYFMGHYLADKKWGMKSMPFPEQGNLQQLQNILLFFNQSGISSHRYFLEAFDPIRNDDPNRWIPKGLLQDLCDDDVESFSESHVIDRVSNFKPVQLFKALQPDVRDIYDYKAKLLRQNNFYQADQVKELFAQYGY